MKKYRLYRDDNYNGNVVEIHNKKEVARVFSNVGKIKIFSVFMALGLSISLSFNIKNYFKNKVDNVNELYMNMEYYDTEKISINLFNYRDVYKELEDEYNNMSNEEKSNYVISVFNSLIDNNDEFTDAEKEDLKKYEGSFFREYGYNYYFENIFDMVSRLKRVKVRRNKELGKNAYGEYWNRSNVIILKNDIDNEALAHEIEHASTIDDGIPSHDFIMESIDSSTDVWYYGCNSYYSTMRMQMIFLSEIIGRDNLIKVYLNSDFKLLEELLGEDYDELMVLFENEFNDVNNDVNNDVLDEELTLPVANKLKEIYEKKYNCKLYENRRMQVIYDGCIKEPTISDTNTFFEDNLSITRDGVNLVFLDDEIIIDNFRYTVKGNDISATYINKPVKKNKKEKSEPMGRKKLAYFFPPKVVDKVINSKNPKRYLKVYLEELGIYDSGFWTYNLLNDKYPVLRNVDGFYYNEDYFYGDLSIILADKYKYLKDKNELDDFYKDFDIFYLDQSNFDDNDFEEFFDNSLDYDDKLSGEDVINMYNSRNNGRKR